MPRNPTSKRAPAALKTWQVFAEKIMEVIGHVPQTAEPPSKHPQGRAQVIAKAAARKAALTAGTLALPPGPLGWLTILPDLVAVWKIQAQMVSDIASVYGKHPSLTREQMIYCLFRQAAAQTVGDLVVRLGDRVLVRRPSLRAIQKVAQRISVKLTQRAIGKALSRFVPLLSAVGVGAYAYYDTKKVGATAMDLFSHAIEFEPQSTDAS
jgi:hypothetical protein